MKRILIVDDNADSRYALALQLDRDYEILQAGTGAEALELARARRPDCILLDVEMPGMDGLAVCRRLRAEPETRLIPVILVTAHARGTRSVVAGLGAGADEYVTKPVEQQELRARVAAMLRIRDLQDRLEVLNAELEAEVRRRTRELRQIYATVPVGIYTLDLAGRITSFNDHLQAMLGYREADVVGKLRIGDLFGEDYDAAYWLQLCRREGRTECETDARTRAGDPAPVFDERVVTTDEVGEPAGFVGYMQDLTQRRRIRRFVKEQETQAAVGRLAAGIVHEIANPVSGVGQYLDAMLTRLDRGDAIPPDEMRRGAEVMRDALNRTTDLIRNLRGFTRPAVRPVVRVDLRALLEDLRALMRHTLHRGGIEMRVEGASGARATVSGDAGRLGQVFMNLVTNARDAMPDGGTLTATVRRDGDACEVSFRDTGAGIPPEELPHVFDFLFTTKGEAGTGYGLSISKDIVEEHGGSITVESRPGDGTTFTVRLPA